MSDTPGFIGGAMRKGLLVALLAFIVLAGLTISIGLYYYRFINQQLTLSVYNHRLVVASLTASGIKLKLDHLEGIAISFAAQDDMRAEIIGGRWEDAMAKAEDLSNSPDFYDYYIDRTLLVDASGAIRAAYPLLSGTMGLPKSNFKEWSVPLENGQAAYVSDVYERSVSPRINVVDVVAPVAAHSVIYGFVVLQVPINEFSDFGQDTDISSNGFAYIVDRKGQIVYHPKYSSVGPIVDYSEVPAVQKLLSGETGIGILSNPIERTERVSAYELVPTYGWGVVSVEPTADAFEARNSILHQILLAISVLCASELFLAIFIFWLVTRSERSKPNAGYARQFPKTPPRASGGFTLIELLVVIAIIAVLSIVVILTLNPTELLRQARDSDRISDLSIIKSAISIYLVDLRNPIIASSTEYCYESVLAANVTTTYSTWFPSIPLGNATTSPQATYRNIDGTGWIHVNFTQISAGTPFGQLPIDPLNNAQYMYMYVGSSTQSTFKLATDMESSKYGNGGAADVESKDGGTDPNKYEAGSNLNL